MIALLCIWFVLSYAHRHGRARHEPCFVAQPPVSSGSGFPSLPSGPWERVCRDGTLSTDRAKFCAECNAIFLCVSVKDDCPVVALSRQDIPSLDCVPEGAWYNTCAYKNTDETRLLCASCDDEDDDSCVDTRQCVGKHLEYIAGSLVCIPFGTWEASCTLASVTDSELCASCRVGTMTQSSCANISGTHCQALDNVAGRLVCFPGGAWRTSCRSSLFISGSLLQSICFTQIQGYSAELRSSLNISGCAQLSVYNFNGQLQCKQFPPGRWNQSCIPRTFEDSQLCANCITSNDRPANLSCLNVSECLLRDGVIENQNGTLICVPGGPWVTNQDLKVDLINATTLCISGNRGQSCIGWNLCKSGSISWTHLRILSCNQKPQVPLGLWSDSCAPLSLSGKTSFCANCLRLAQSGRELVTSCIDPTLCPTSLVSLNGTLSCLPVAGGTWKESCIPTSYSAPTLCASCPNRIGNFVQSCVDTTICEKDSVKNNAGTLGCIDIPSGLWSRVCTFDSLIGFSLCATCRYETDGGRLELKVSCLDVSTCSRQVVCSEGGNLNCC